MSAAQMLASLWISRGAHSERLVTCETGMRNTSISTRKIMSKLRPPPCVREGPRHNWGFRSAYSVPHTTGDVVRISEDGTPAAATDDALRSNFHVFTYLPFPETATRFPLHTRQHFRSLATNKGDQRKRADNLSGKSFFFFGFAGRAVSISGWRSYQLFQTVLRALLFCDIGGRFSG